MRTLVLMRHATAASEPFDRDRDRALTDEGRGEAAAAGSLLAGIGITHVLCSPALRTRETASCLALPGDPDIEVLDALYLCGTNTLLQHIADVPDIVTSLLVVAHSPTVPGLAARMASGPSPRVAEDLWARFPPASWAHFDIDGTWAELGRMPYALGSLRRVERP
ncbi:MAG: histidine phosphatase family protein [Propionibacterium sp.]|nr:histidine phosphatase family protein [Propionibacterium sp.]